MKKNLTKWLALLLACLMMLASCGGDEPTTESNAPELTPTEKLLAMNEKARALTLYGYVDEAMDACNSYTMEGKGSFSGSMMGFDVDVSIDMLEKSVGNEKAFEAKYASTKTAVMMSGEVISESESSSGFYDGKMFFASVADGVENGIYSSISAEDYVRYEKEQEDDTDFDPASCSSMTCVQNADKTWTATYKDFENFEELEDMLDTLTEMLEEGVTVDDIEITMTVNEDFTLRSILMKFVFILAPGTTDVELPTYQMEFQVKDLDKTKAEEVDFEGYNEVENLLVAIEVEKAFAEYLDAESGSYTVVIDESVRYATEIEKTNTIENVSFRNEDGKLFFTIKAVSSDEDYDYYLTYENGMIKTEAKDGNTVVQSETEDCSESEAKSYLISLFNPAGFSVNAVSAIKVVDAQNGVYEFTLNNVDMSEMGGIGSETLTVTLKDGKMSEANYCVESSMEYEGISMTMKLQYFVLFD